MYKYLFSIRVDSTLEKSGEISLDSFIEMTPEDQENIQLAKSMVDNEIWKTTPDEAFKACNVSHFAMIHGFQMRAHMNQLSIHMVESEFQLSREDLGTWIKSCNYDPIAKQKLLMSELRRRKKE